MSVPETLIPQAFQAEGGYFMLVRHSVWHIAADCQKMSKKPYITNRASGNRTPTWKDFLLVLLVVLVLIVLAWLAYFKFHLTD